MITLVIITTLIISTSAATMLVINPLSLGIVILLIAIALTLIYASIMSSWIAFLIFLIYVRGILVIFAYFVSLIPNQPTHYIIFPTIIILTLILIPLIYNLFRINSLFIYKFTNTIYTYNNVITLLILALFLLFAIIVVVKIVTNNKGPLRPFIKYV